MFKKICLTIIILMIAMFGLLNLKNKEDENALIFWTLQLNTFEPYINGVISEFEKENPNIKVKWVDVPYSEGEKRVLASLLSNSVPDLINITSDFSITLAQKNALTLLDVDDVKNFNQQILKPLKQEDKFIAFPFYATSAITIYNKELAKQAGLTNPPTTYDELNEITPQFFKATNTFAQMPTLCENDTFLKILNKYGINNYKDFNSQKTKQLYETYKYLYENNFIPQEAITQTHREVLEKYGAGQIGFLQSGANFLNIIKENSPNVYSKTAVAPQLRTQNSGYDFSLMTLAIPLKSKHKEEAKKFANFLLNSKNQLEFAKLTSILPTNTLSLQDEYFTSPKENDIISQARSISAGQLNNLQSQIYFKKNQKEIINLLNTSTQTILLNKNSVEKEVRLTSQTWQKLCEEK